MVRIIPVSGWKGSGKDTFHQYVSYGRKVVRIAYADVLKDDAAKTYNLPRECFDAADQKEAPLLQYPVCPKDTFSKVIVDRLVDVLRYSDGSKPTMVIQNESGYLLGLDGRQLYWTPRALAILEGSTRRAVDSQYWVKRALRDIDVGADTWYVITDWRYQSEFEGLMDILEKLGLGRDVVTTIRINRWASTTSQDPSERDLDDYQFDIVLDNTGDLRSFYEKIDQTLFPAGDIVTN